jgi:hypothetical protein
MGEIDYSNSTKRIQFWNGASFWNYGLPMGRSQQMSASTSIFVDGSLAPLMSANVQRRGGGCTPRLPRLTPLGCGRAESWQQATFQQLQLLLLLLLQQLPKETRKWLHTTSFVSRTSWLWRNRVVATSNALVVVVAADGVEST